MNHLSYVEISIYHPELYLLSSFTEGVPLCYQRDGRVYKRRTGDPLCVYNDKEVSKVTLDRSSPRIINGKYLTMTPRYKSLRMDHHRIINGKSLIMTLQYILIPDPIQFYNHLIRIVSLSLVDAFLCHIIFFIKDAAIFIKLFTSIEMQHLLNFFNFSEKMVL